jgi:hypothetical protein
MSLPGESAKKVLQAAKVVHMDYMAKDADKTDEKKRNIGHTYAPFTFQYTLATIFASRANIQWTTCK